MNERSAKHAQFVIERIYGAKPDRVFAAWANAAWKAQWFQKAEEFDFRVGGREFSRGGPPGGPIYTFDANYQEIVEGRRIVYSYSLDQGSTRISVSVVTVELQAVESGTRLVYTEQGVFLDGHDKPEQREHGTNLMLDKLGEILLSKESIHKRVIDAPRDVVFSAWTTPELLARWWGPTGFTNTFQEFDLRPGGHWKFIMHGPNGVDYPNECVFVEINSPERIVLNHIATVHQFYITADFEDVDGKTSVTFAQRFETVEELASIEKMIKKANEENLDRLSEVVSSLAGRT
ncbi:uncharacterized protein YndB with AHSA1/START domain [Cohnella lupini]|uniref:Uncharacterized protein YndB with AHSA1/START domain n=1 Tax=Cohnella lupini TaxID=1294267 RepID=A0A3D9IT63_9BACL|nr:uncharacterized protein YndB with AHSA1/START domain [Cohnella lupini]